MDAIIRYWRLGIVVAAISLPAGCDEMPGHAITGTTEQSAPSLTFGAITRTTIEVSWSGGAIARTIIALSSGGAVSRGFWVIHRKRPSDVEWRIFRSKVPWTKFTGLTPGQAYQFRIKRGESGQWSAIYTRRTRP